MRVSFRLKQILGKDADRRGVIVEMERITGVERHTISALMNSRPTSVNLEILGKICEYLVNVKHIPAHRLPGALFGFDPEDFWDLMGSCERIEFCVGTRKAKEWQGSNYVMSTDSRLQGVLLSRISQAKYGPDRNTPSRRKSTQTDDNQATAPGQQAEVPDGEDVPGMRFFSEFHLVPAPGREARPSEPGKEWKAVRACAERVYCDIRSFNENRALIALGSIKVNPVVELMLADAFSAAPFTTQDNVKAGRERQCPVFFRCRDNDPQPPSFCGGTKLAVRNESSAPGIYYEEAKGNWVCCPWSKDDNDVAFLYYANKCTSGLVEIACGGYSARSTGLLTDNLEQVVSRLDDPQYDTENLRLGLYLITFRRKPAKRGTRTEDGRRDWEFQVVPVAKHAVRRRLS